MRGAGCGAVSIEGDFQNQNQNQKPNRYYGTDPIHMELKSFFPLGCLSIAVPTHVSLVGFYMQVCCE
jgi:hypothetical protein